MGISPQLKNTAFPSLVSGGIKKADKARGTDPGAEQSSVNSYYKDAGLPGGGRLPGTLNLGEHLWLTGVASQRGVCRSWRIGDGGSLCRPRSQPPNPWPGRPALNLGLEWKVSHLGRYPRLCRGPSRALKCWHLIFILCPRLWPVPNPVVMLIVHRPARKAAFPGRPRQALTPSILCLLRRPFGPGVQSTGQPGDF